MMCVKRLATTVSGQQMLSPSTHVAAAFLRICLIGLCLPIRSRSPRVLVGQREEGQADAEVIEAVTAMLAAHPWRR